MLNWTGRRWRSSAFVNLEPLSDAYQVIGSSVKGCPLGSVRRMPARTLRGLASVNSCFQVGTDAVARGRSSLHFPISSNTSTAGRTEFAFASFDWLCAPFALLLCQLQPLSLSQSIGNATVGTSSLIFRHRRVDLDSVSLRNCLRGVRRGRTGQCLRSAGRRGGSAGWCGLRRRSGLAGRRRGVRR